MQSMYLAALKDHVLIYDGAMGTAVQARRIGMHLTEAYQLVPEQSTVAIIAHHPQARYFAACAAPRSSVESP